MEKEINIEQELYKHFGRVKDFTLCTTIAKRFYEMGKKHQEPVSKDLEEELKQFFYPYVPWGDYSTYEQEDIKEWSLKIAIHFAQWQRQKDEHLIWNISSANYEKGKEEGKWEMMKDAVEVNVKADSDGLYTTETWEEMNNLLHKIGAKEGDKVKIVIIRDEED